MTLITRFSPGRRTLRSARAFTLLEILLVLAIVGLLVGLAVVNVDSLFGGAKIQAAEMMVKSQLKSPLTAYRMHLGDYPSTSEGLQALVTAPANRADRWRGPYLADGKLPNDPWERPYQYRYPGTHNKQSYDLFSFGPDGQESADDIKNW